MEREVIGEKKIHERDPFRRLSNVGRRIEQKLDILDAQMEIVLLGTMHTGNIGEGIKSAINTSSIVSMELPTVTVNSYLSNTESKIGVNSFWAQAIDYSKGRIIVPANDERDSVDSIRAVRSKFSDDFKRANEAAKISLSSKYPELVTGVKRTNPHIVELLGDEFVLNYEDSSSIRNHPVISSVMVEGVPLYFHKFMQENKGEKVRAVVSGSEWALPSEIAYEGVQTLPDKYISEYPIAADLLKDAVAHMVRLRGDRRQMEELLKESDSLLQDAVKRGYPRRNLKVVHIGGFDHNKNLKAMLDHACKSSRVSFQTKHDERIFAFAPDSTTFFANFMNAENALSATTSYGGEVFINRKKGMDVILDALGNIPKGELSAFYKRNNLSYEFLDFRTGAEVYQIEDYAVSTLLKMIDQSDYDRLPQIDNSYPYNLAQFVMINYPERLDDVYEILQVLQKKEANFAKDSWGLR